MIFINRAFVALPLVLFVSAFWVADQATAQAWRPLFNGVSLQGWMADDGSPVSGDVWSVSNLELQLDTSRGRGGNIVTEELFGDFELLFEWKNSAGGNNGIKYRVNDFGGRTLGCEYQVIDDVGHEGLKPTQKTAALYDVYEPVEHDVLNPPGEWNRGRIVVRASRIEHWLNGHLVMSANVDSDEWNRRVAASKFGDLPDFGRTPTGRIMITDHGDQITYRNVFIRSLKRGGLCPCL